MYRRKIGTLDAISQEFATQMTFISEELNRVVAVLVDRSGKVEHVMLGDSHRVYLPDLGRQRAGQSRFRGVRLIRTHPGTKGREVELSREDLTDLSKLQLDLVMSIGVGPGGYPGQVAWAHLVPENPEQRIWETYKAPNPAEVGVSFTHFITELEGEFQRKAADVVTTGGQPALLAYVATPEGRPEEVEVAEMLELCRTAGVDVVDTLVQRRSGMHPKYALGKGKIEELTLRALQLDVDLIIFAQDLSPTQLRGITDETDIKVIDRTQLILDIFAQRATSSDGKVQVELAQLKYNLPRLHSRNTGMSRLTGGIGGRGPGETKLEINRRRARDRIRSLEKDIEKLSKQREVRRARRMRNQLPTVSIVGYTNAGKSTLLNALTNSEVLSEDKLFATLQPTTRKLRFPDEREIIFTDTVGFIHDLPADLVAAFKATLEELDEADILVHLIDVSDERFDDKMEAVNRILTEIDLGDKEQLLVFNKSDLLEEGEAASVARAYNAIAVSALEPASTERLVEELETRLFRQARQRETSMEARH
ncbi:GTPase HflX [Lujinxingia sediminis]|uniref:GTPase HflX n=1 Tax=Lujinxingia sediminis TaxID=2480984 RepID=A0ABY0CNE7_9DELT|nr:GTPase HflX [Lujinxingia sediminis]RVU40685.1 GTPase HflX [Lujinxingia sediminis]